MIQMKHFKKIVLLLVASFILASCGDMGNKKKISIAYVNWAEGISMTYLAKAIFEDQGYKVQLKNADVAPVFAALAKKDADVFLDAWLPVTHEDYFEKYGDKIEIGGDLFTEASIGLVVPTYVSINSIEELNANKDKFEKEIVGIDAGAGIMKVTDIALKDYDLDFKLLSATGPMMTASLQKAIADDKWVVVTGWKPHWMFSRFDLKFLDDPKGVYGKAEVIKSVFRKGFKEDDPFAAELISNMHFTNEQISSLMDEVDNAPTEVMGAKSWIKNNQELVNSWIPEKVEVTTQP